MIAAISMIIRIRQSRRRRLIISRSSCWIIVYMIRMSVIWFIVCWRSIRRKEIVQSIIMVCFGGVRRRFFRLRLFNVKRYLKYFQLLRKGIRLKRFNLAQRFLTPSGQSKNKSAKNNYNSPSKSKRDITQVNRM